MCKILRFATQRRPYAGVARPYSGIVFVDQIDWSLLQHSDVVNKCLGLKAGARNGRSFGRARPNHGLAPGRRPGMHEARPSLFTAHADERPR